MGYIVKIVQRTTHKVVQLITLSNTSLTAHSPPTLHIVVCGSRSSNTTSGVSVMLISTSSMRSLEALNIPEPRLKEYANQVREALSTSVLRAND